MWNFSSFIDFFLLLFSFFFIWCWKLRKQWHIAFVIITRCQTCSIRRSCNCNLINIYSSIAYSPRVFFFYSISAFFLSFFLFKHNNCLFDRIIREVTLSYLEKSRRTCFAWISLVKLALVEMFEILRIIDQLEENRATFSSSFFLSRDINEGLDLCLLASASARVWIMIHLCSTDWFSFNIEKRERKNLLLTCRLSRIGIDNGWNNASTLSSSTHRLYISRKNSLLLGVIGCLALVLEGRENDDDVVDKRERERKRDKPSRRMNPC